MSQQVRNGEGTLFWKDTWLDNCPLKIRFCRLFNICSNPDITVAGCLVNDEWSIEFIRQFGQTEAESWDELKRELVGVSLVSSDSDKVKWCLESSGNFSVKSLYCHISFGGVSISRNMKLWKSKIPLKVKIFI